ncbi:MAG: cytochrome c biogenesis protein [Kiritimatiellia bacterium]
MSWKGSLLGGGIYLAMLGYWCCAVLARTRRERWSRWAWMATGAIALGVVALRSFETRHWPMQNLFEFFLCLGAVLPWVSLGTQSRLKVDTRLADALMGLILLFPAGFVFDDGVKPLPPALRSPLFMPHVGAYVLGYVLLFRGAVMALPWFRAASVEKVRDRAVSATVLSGYLLISFGMVLGAIWGKLAWGHYWQWDPKECWSLATWLVFTGWLHFRLRFGLTRPRLSAGILWLGVVGIVLTLTWVNLSRLFPGLHNYAQ